MSIVSEKLENSAGFKRIEMPQVDFEDFPDLLKSLTKSGVLIKIKLIEASKLKFSQNEIDEDKIKDKLDKKSKQYQSRFYLVSRANYLVDGHHDLAQALKTYPKAKLICFVCDSSIDELIELINSFKISYNEK